jgi:hypothetical protein
MVKSENVQTTGDLDHQIINAFPHVAKDVDASKRMFNRHVSLSDSAIGPFFLRR